MKKIEVVVGVVCNEVEGTTYVLLTKRPKGKHLEGLWEFPGGKVEAGEPLDIALKRELEEEIHFKESEIVELEPLTYVEHYYDDVSVALHCFYILSDRIHFTGTMIMAENQIGKWVPLSALIDEPMPAANTKIVEALLKRKVRRK